MRGHFPTVSIGSDGARIRRSKRPVFQARTIVANRQRELIGYQPLCQQVKRKRIGHFPHHQARSLRTVSMLKHLPRRLAIDRRLVLFDFAHGHRLVAPRVINQKLGVFPKQLEQQIFVELIAAPAQRATRNIAHGEHAVRLKLARISSAHAPNIRERTMRPNAFFIRLLVKHRNANTVLIRLFMLSKNIKGNFRKEQVRADSRRCGNARCLKNVGNHRRGKRFDIHLVDVCVFRRVNEHFVDGIHVNVLGREILQIHLVYFR